MVITHSVRGLHPLIYGFVASITVFVGTAMLYVFRGRASQTALGALQAFAGGILACIALEIGAEVAGHVESLAKWETWAVFAGRCAHHGGVCRRLLVAFVG